MALAGFAPSGYNSVTATTSQQVAALPGGGGATLLITNMGDGTAVVLLQAGATPPSPAINNSTGLAILPRAAVPLTVGANDHIVFIGMGANAQLNLVQGT